MRKEKKAPEAKGKERYFADLKRLAKVANQRMVELERRGIKSPAYNAVQGKLEILGRRGTDKRGRRFSETGKATYNEYEYIKKQLNEFINAQTSTIRGAKKWEEDVWQGALKSNKKLFLQGSGITKDDWLEFWQNMPAKQKDRTFGSETIVEMLRTYTIKQNGEEIDEQRMSIKEIAEAIQNAKNTKAAHKALGINYKDIKKSKSLGAL